MKRREVDWKSCYSGTPLCELERLQEYCRQVAESSVDFLPELAIEIGSHEGASAAVLAEWFDTVICVDPWGKEELLSPKERMASYVGCPGSNIHFPAFMSNMERLGLFDGPVIPIVGTSAILDALPPLGASLVFVDNGHNYSCCSADIRRGLRHLKPDGLLVCHDYKRPEYYEPDNSRYINHVDPYLGVAQALDEAVFLYDLEMTEHFEGICCLVRRKPQ